MVFHLGGEINNGTKIVDKCLCLFFCFHTHIWLVGFSLSLIETQFFSVVFWPYLIPFVINLTVYWAWVVNIVELIPVGKLDSPTYRFLFILRFFSWMFLMFFSVEKGLCFYPANTSYFGAQLNSHSGPQIRRPGRTIHGTLSPASVPALGRPTTSWRLKTFGSPMFSSPISCIWTELYTEGYIMPHMVKSQPDVIWYIIHMSESYTYQCLHMPMGIQTNKVTNS